MLDDLAQMAPGAVVLLVAIAWLVVLDWRWRHGRCDGRARLGSYGVTLDAPCSLRAGHRGDHEP